MLLSALWRVQISAFLLFCRWFCMLCSCILLSMLAFSEEFIPDFRCHKRGLRKDLYLLWADSQSEIASPVVDSIFVRECKTDFNEIGNLNRVTVLWNEKAEISASADRQLLRNRAIFWHFEDKEEIWQKSFVRRELLNFNRSGIKRVVEVVTDHCPLNKHLRNISTIWVSGTTKVPVWPKRENEISHNYWLYQI